ncbi:MAG: DUF4248 domain-containing protein [Bacteroidaceae bacterium]|nr:DUF4248 domain-containing protein [Bacteroidaceae bacterium]
MNTEFKVRSYGRRELAMLYCPDIAPASAHKKFNLWIGRSPGLLDRLRQLGYSSGQRQFTPIQVQLIVNAIGEP